MLDEPTPEDLLVSRWTHTDKIKPVEEMTPHEALAVGFRDGWFKGRREAIDLLARSIPAEEVAYIIGG